MAAKARQVAASGRGGISHWSHNVRIALSTSNARGNAEQKCPACPSGHVHDPAGLAERRCAARRRGRHPPDRHRAAKNALACVLAKGTIKRVERCRQRAAICPVPAASDLPGWLHKLLNKLGNPLGNGVTVAQQTLTLFVLVRIQVPQPLRNRSITSTT